MRTLSLLVSLSALAVASSFPQQPRSIDHLHGPIPTIWLAGNSTEAPGGGGNGTEGWGQYLQYSFLRSVALVNNSAIAGRSARSYTREGRFNTIAQELKEGDWVVIEFGHNDGGTPPVNAVVGDKGRADCPGAGLLPSPGIESLCADDWA
jgi:rhamnogalacturonan acetylesterase